MSRTLTAVTSALCVSMLIAAGDAAAQGARAGLAGQRAGAAGQRANRAQPQFAAQEVARMLDAYAIVQAQDALQLSEEQYGLFVPRLKRLQDTRRRLQQQRNQIIGELRRLAAGTGAGANTAADEATLRERLRALREHDERSASELRKAYDALDEVIDVRQQARFRAFEETIERRKFDLLMRARQAARRGGTD